MAVEWIATEGTVTTCRYQFARMNTFTLGIQMQSKYRIGFEYYAHGRLYSDEFQSTVAIAQNERIAVSYNPLDPQQNSRGRASSSRTAAGPGSLIGFGVAGSIVLSLLWLLVLRGCG
jgi:hypothetical protein